MPTRIRCGAAICLSEDAYRQVKGRLDLAVADLGPTHLKNIAEPIRVYSLRGGQPAEAKPKALATRPRWVSAPLAAAIAALVLLAAVAGSFVFGGRLTKPTQA